MSKRKDKERAIRDGPFRGPEFKPSSRVLVEAPTFKCFVCNNVISVEEANKLTKHATAKPKDTIARETRILLGLLKGRNPEKSRICRSCYREWVEGVSDSGR